jgi:hypothetical protein
MNAARRSAVRARAGLRCEYCRLHEDDDPFAPFHVEHIRALKHKGTDDLDNLALACHSCNLHKGANLSGIDPLTDALVPLFHPRRQRWKRHFRWDGPLIIGRTRSGRATVAVLAMNEDSRAAIRAPLIAAGLFPPAE